MSHRRKAFVLATTWRNHYTISHFRVNSLLKGPMIRWIIIKNGSITALSWQISSCHHQIRLKPVYHSCRGQFVIFSHDGCDVMKWNLSAPLGVDTKPVIATVLTFCSYISWSLLWSNNSSYLLKCPDPWAFTNNPALYYFSFNATLLPICFLWNAFFPQCW